MPNSTLRTFNCKSCLLNILNMPLLLCCLFLALSDDRSLIFSKRGRNGHADKLHHCTEFRRAGRKAGPAFYTFFLVHYVDLALGADDRLYRTFLGASHTGLTLFRIDII